MFCAKSIILKISIISISVACSLVTSNAYASPSLFELSLKTDENDPDSANWIVDGFVDQRPYRFYLDTGAAITRLQYDDFTSKFKTNTQNKSSGAFTKHHDDLIVIPNLRIGPLSKSSITVARVPKNVKGKDNLLGMNFLKDFALYFEFDELKVKILTEPLTTEVGELHNLFLGERFHPYVDLSWDGDIKAKGVWDTGAGMTCLDLAFVKKHPELFTRLGTSTGKDSSGTQAKTPVFLMKGFTLGGKRFPSTKVVVIDLSVPNSTIKTPMDFILGYNILSKANWYFDFPKRKWAIIKRHQ